MRRFKRVIAVSLALAMGASLVACGGASKTPATEATEGANSSESTSESETEEAATEEEADLEAAKAEADLSSDGKVLNIECWDDTFARRLADHYPGFQANDPNNAVAGGKIGDIEVKFTVNKTNGNAYQNRLDTTLPGNANVEEDDRVDIFLVEADYALKYANTDLCMPVSDLGISDSELLGQYKYTKDIVTDANGNIKGLSWQACPGVLIYNREAAIEIIGSDDPEAVQEAVCDWETYNNTAQKALEAGYKMTATVNDTYRVFSDNASAPWVVDGQIVVDDNIKKWVDISKEQVDANVTGTGDLWSDEWAAGFYPDGGIFCYFGPSWLFDFEMAADDPASIAAQGGWGVTTGPQMFSWGGTWICAADGTDNPALVADIMRKLTVDTDIMKEIVEQDNEFVNNKPAMEEMSQDVNYGDEVLGGQNELTLLCAQAENIDRANVSMYDQGCTECFQSAMRKYFEGTTPTYEEALDEFFKNVTERYPELTY